jgi:hypothetical protein
VPVGITIAPFELIAEHSLGVVSILRITAVIARPSAFARVSQAMVKGPQHGVEPKRGPIIVDREKTFHCRGLSTGLD